MNIPNIPSFRPIRAGIFIFQENSESWKLTFRFFLYGETSIKPPCFLLVESADHGSVDSLFF